MRFCEKRYSLKMTREFEDRRLGVLVAGQLCSDDRERLATHFAGLADYWRSRYGALACRCGECQEVLDGDTGSGSDRLVAGAA